MDIMIHERFLRGGGDEMQAAGWFLLSDYNAQKVGAAINMIS